MRVAHFKTFDELASYADDWDRLAAGVPFRSWTWLSCWWRHYGPLSPAESARRRLAVLCAFDDAGRTVGIALGTWNARRSRAASCGRWAPAKCAPITLACCANRRWAMRWPNRSATTSPKRPTSPGPMPCVGICSIGAASTRPIAKWPHWSAGLAQAGWRTHRRFGANCWRLKLPTAWDEYVAGLGRNFRRDVRRLEREYSPQRAGGLARCRATCGFAPRHGNPGGTPSAASANAGRARLFCVAAFHGVLPRSRTRAVSPWAGAVLLAGIGRQACGGRIPIGGRRDSVCVPSGRRPGHDGPSARQAAQSGHSARAMRTATASSISFAAMSRTRHASARKRGRALRCTSCRNMRRPNCGTACGWPAQT